jgi:galactofuranosylgalactofuranosylrhamnosyl-N-acetylglucosaminyl-diphospho-decaprenol beta-1,5/1,6-galactofuranosyltransferase
LFYTIATSNATYRGPGGSGIRRLADTLGRLLRHDYQDLGRPAVVIVNQGPDFTDPTLLGLLKEHPDDVRVMKQENFGGAGGFTRAAIEAMRQTDASHIVFMDDDIVAHPRSLENMIRFILYTNRDILVGGPMFDLLRPTIMYEAGAVVLPDTILALNHHNINVGDCPNLSRFATETPTHYNGWWFCAIPRACFEQFGLPSPVFLRGDDVEFGLRCGRGGVSSVNLPGLCVWHEPFYARAPGWQRYYDLRNNLILAARIPDQYHSPSPTNLLARFVKYLLVLDYQQTLLLVKAMEDFLAGPELFDKNPQELHTALMAEMKPYAAKPFWHPGGLRHAHFQAPHSRAGRMKTLLRRLYAHYSGKVPDEGLKVVFMDDVTPWTVGLCQRYILADRGLHFHVEFSYDRTAFRTLLKRVLRAVWSYRRNRGAVAARWYAAQQRLISQAFWFDLLGLSREEKPVHDDRQIAA